MGFPVRPYSKGLRWIAKVFLLAQVTVIEFLVRRCCGRWSGVGTWYASARAAKASPPPAQVAIGPPESWQPGLRMGALAGLHEAPVVRVEHDMRNGALPDQGPRAPIQPRNRRSR